MKAALPEITIVSAEEAETLDAVCCMRVADLPIPRVPAQMEQCCKCGERIWVSHSSPRKPKRWCVQCLQAINQHDDHIWLTWMGEGWAIRRIEYPIIHLWRGYEPDLEYSAIDVSKVDWDAYCRMAVQMLSERRE
jgi:hypothetical protein